MVEEEQDDHEAVVKLLELNDIINTTLERYNLVRKGDLAAAAKLPALQAGTLGAAPPKRKQQEVSLIDFDNDANGSGPSMQQSTKSSSLEDDLLGLSFGEAPQSSGGSSFDFVFGSGGGIALGFGANISMPLSGEF